jgi:proteasome lid subunit RPN8/RPN11
LDDVRLAVMDAFFSLPRGGAEIGGLLLGRYEKGRVSIVDAVAMECEHAFGPSFVLSPRDLDKLAGQLAGLGRSPQAKILGWYHSHTRSEIFLSDVDLEIHNRFFPEPWQVALVLKPHTFQPMRAGFFFRARTGLIHATAPRGEFVLEAMPMRPVPANGAPDPTPLFRSPRDAEPEGPIITVAGVVEPDPPPADPGTSVAPELTPPSFLTAPPPPSRQWIAPLAAVLIGTSLGAWAYQTRSEWLPKVQSIVYASAVEKVGLSSIDRDGQLQIQWNGNSRAALASNGASLLIVDGDRPLNVELGRPHVLTGSFTYARRSGRVDVTLVLTQPGGKEVREAAIFNGDAPGAPRPLPAPAPAEAATSAGGASNAASLTAEIARLKLENAVQVERNKRLEKTLEDLRKLMLRDEQRKRLEVQSHDRAK